MADDTPHTPENGDERPVIRPRVRLARIARRTPRTSAQHAVEIGHEVAVAREPKHLDAATRLVPARHPSAAPQTVARSEAAGAAPAPAVDP